MIKCPHCGSTAQVKILDIEELLRSSFLFYLFNR